MKRHDDMPEKPLILVVDDKEVTCEAIESSLKLRGYRVHTAQRVEKGIKCLEDSLGPDWKQGPYAVAILDLDFSGAYDGPDPNTAGMHVLRKAVSIPFLESIILTAYPSVDTAAEAVEKGAFRYVTKSEHGQNNERFMGRLVAAVELAIETRQVMMALHEDLEQLKKSLAKFRASGAGGEILDYAKFVVDDAEKVYDRILRARGKHPDVGRPPN